VACPMYLTWNQATWATNVDVCRASLQVVERERRAGAIRAMLISLVGCQNGRDRIESTGNGGAENVLGRASWHPKSKDDNYNTASR
jgi:hypothetical protein